MFKLFFNILGRVLGAASNFMHYHLYAKGDEVTTKKNIVHSLFSTSLMALSIIGGYTHKIHKGVSIVLTLLFAFDAEAQIFAHKEVK